MQGLETPPYTPGFMSWRSSAIIRSVLEYCCAVWKKRIIIIRIILPGFHYKDALKTLNCTTLFERREQLCLKTIKKICEGGPLSKNLPVFRDSIHGYNTRISNSPTLILCLTERLRSSFFSSWIKLLNSC